MIFLRSRSDFQAFQTKIAELTPLSPGPNITSHHPMPSRRDAAHQPSHRYRSPSRSRSPVVRRSGGYLWHWELTRSVTTLADAFLDQETHPETLEGMWAEAADLRNRFIQHMEDRKVKHEGYSDPKGRNQEQIEANSQPSVVNWIGKLQELCQKRAARPLEKHEVCFTTETLSTHPNVFQSVVRSELFSNGPFEGERCSSKKAAEHSASAAAIEGEFPQFFDNPEGQQE